MSVKQLSKSVKQLSMSVCQYVFSPKAAQYVSKFRACGGHSTVDTIFSRLRRAQFSMSVKQLSKSVKQLSMSVKQLSKSVKQLSMSVNFAPAAGTAQ